MDGWNVVLMSLSILTVLEVGSITMSLSLSGERERIVEC